MSMGFHEDDRIRRKNIVHNEAYDLVEQLRGMGATDSDIVESIKLMQLLNNRNEIYSTVLKIVGGSRNENTIKNCSINSSTGRDSV